MRNGEEKREEVVQRKIGYSEVKVVRFYFTEDEQSRDLDKIDLGEKGKFYARYIEPELRRIYGYWMPTEEAAEEYNEYYEEEINAEDGPFWASLDYEPADEAAEKRERDLLGSWNVYAHNFLEIPWRNYYVYLENEEEEQA